MRRAYRFEKNVRRRQTADVAGVVFVGHHAEISGRAALLGLADDRVILVAAVLKLVRLHRLGGAELRAYVCQIATENVANWLTRLMLGR